MFILDRRRHRLTIHRCSLRDPVSKQIFEYWFSFDFQGQKKFSAWFRRSGFHRFRNFPGSGVIGSQRSSEQHRFGLYCPTILKSIYPETWRFPSFPGLLSLLSGILVPSGREEKEDEALTNPRVAVLALHALFPHTCANQLSV